MYKTLKVGDKEYHLEYSVEAFMTRYTNDEGKSENHVMPLLRLANSADDNIATAFELPNAVAHALYAGLLRYHGNTKRGDKSITSVEEAAELAFEIIEENEDNELGSWSALLNICTEQMTEDGFFEKLGGKTAKA